MATADLPAGAGRRRSTNTLRYKLPGHTARGQGDRQGRGDAGGRGAMDKEEEQEEEVDGNGQRGPDGRREDAAYTENFVGRRGAVRLGLLCLSEKGRGRTGGGRTAALVAEATPAAGVMSRG